MVEKQNSGLIDGWTPRYIAFDTTRRHLYYSDNLMRKEHRPLSRTTSQSNLNSSVTSRVTFGGSSRAVSPAAAAVTPQDSGQLTSVSAVPSSQMGAIAEEDSSPLHRQSTAAFSSSEYAPASRPMSAYQVTRPVSPLPAVNFLDLSQELVISDAPNSPRVGSPMQNIKWKAKFKVDSIYVHARNKSIAKKEQLYQIDISGSVRELAMGEAPSGYLLAPSTCLNHLPNLNPEHRQEFLKDPFGLEELFNSLRDQCIVRRRERELAIAKRKMENPQYKLSAEEKGPPYGTLRSPVKKNEFLAFHTDKAFSIRFTNEYEYTRFLYVLLLVMGYDQLSARPFKGYPPLDPRNGIALSPIPATAAYALSRLDGMIPYLYVYGNLIGRSKEGELQISLKNCYLCMTCDMIFPVRATGTIPTWLFQSSVREFRYNTESSSPYVAFLSDQGAPDIVFAPCPHPLSVFLPGYRMSPKVEVERIRFTLHSCCFASMEARRVIQFHPSPYPSVRTFVAGVEAEFGAPLDFRFVTTRKNHTPFCAAPVNLKEVWRAAGTSAGNMDHYTMENAAVPIYDTFTNSTELSLEQVHMVRSLVEQQNLDDELVGLALSSVTSMGRGAAPPESPHDDPFIKSTSSRPLNDEDGSTTLGSVEDSEVIYGPGAQYVRTDAAQVL